jgi:hypothetical protein
MKINKKILYPNNNPSFIFDKDQEFNPTLIKA